MALNVECRYVESHFCECRLAECRYSECRYTDCRGIQNLMGLSTKTFSSVKYANKCVTGHENDAQRSFARLPRR